MSLFWTKTLEVSVVGLQSSGKTSFVNVLDVGGFTEDVAPTIAFNMRKGSSIQHPPAVHTYADLCPCSSKRQRHSQDLGCCGLV